MLIYNYGGVIMKIRKIIITVMVCLFMFEGVLLGLETKSYLTTNSSHINVNGRIIAELDNTFNFSNINK